ncbi:pyridoxamine 5'-phosphate oxidase family protein [Kribbella sancticallisti]|uniref:Pyridoxamine 5'-phosphate oxidase family protein n=1 Tax=Kribbella sancticallisti TaxID=460087 RepID=A0ABP4QLU3_9ACTN
MSVQHPAEPATAEFTLAPEPTGGRSLIELDPAEAFELLAGAGYGRIVFSHHALPAIRPVNHFVSDGQIIIRSRLSATVAGATGTVVAYEADDLDPLRRLGWSVVVTGIARTIDDPARVARYEQALRPWVELPMDVVIAIQPEIITGYRLVETSAGSDVTR